MPRTKKSRKIVELICAPDAKNKKKLICEEPVVGVSRSASDIEQDSTSEVELASRPSVVIGAINIGTRPIKEYFATRWGQHYHPRLPHGGKHLIADILMAAAIVGLVGWNLFFWLADKPRSSDLELQISSQSKQGQLNQPISFRVLYNNDSEDDLQDVSIFLRPSSGLKVIEVKGVDFSVENQGVKIGSLLSGEVGDFEVVTKPINFGHQNLRVVAQWQNEKGKAGEAVNVAPVDISKPQLSFKAFARYYSPEGDQIGRGPLPPKIGETTKYQVYWILENGPYGFENIVATGTLADNVSWTGFTPLGSDDLMYDSLTRKLTWKPSKVKTSLNLSPSQGAIFEVALRPDSWQKGQLAPLLMDVKISGKEQLTGITLKVEVEDITTALVGDKKAEGKGVVTE